MSASTEYLLKTAENEKKINLLFYIELYKPLQVFGRINYNTVFWIRRNKILIITSAISLYLSVCIMQ